jgi:hypothetical protein
MIMNVHSDTSYLSKPDARSHPCGHFIMGCWTTSNGDTIKLNGAFLTLCAILRFVASSTKAKLGALFFNCKEDMIFCLTLEELGHPQPKTQVHCNNAMAVGIANNTVKRQHLQSMEMRYFGCVIKLHKVPTMLNGTPGKKILQIIKASIT